MHKPDSPTAGGFHISKSRIDSVERHLKEAVRELRGPGNSDEDASGLADEILDILVRVHSLDLRELKQKSKPADPAKQDSKEPDDDEIGLANDAAADGPGSE